MFFDVGEVAVAGEERRFELRGEGGGEAIGVGEFLLGFEFCGAAGEFDVGGDYGDGKLGDLREDLAGDTRALIAPNGIVDFAPVDDAHEKFALAIRGEADELLDLGRARAVVKKCQKGAGVKNNALHSLRSR